MAEANPCWEGPQPFFLGERQTHLAQADPSTAKRTKCRDANQYSLACGVLDLIPATRIWGEGTQQQPYLYRQKRRTKKKRRNHPLQRTVGNETCTECIFSFLCNRGSLTNERVGLPSTCLHRLYREKTPPEAAEKEKRS
ncbi:hypothetical protein TESG_01893 [Trichophyton tonsurans CBS 112818]|uniref:Uncharacterized protein n=1 Tax=Trichophyton tonsurans (strain CBS 112818) TaxID=647933 RepID=F2RSS5_TRIT1|nr:hypothetical protein TESG_01893 [Trichophyton tonsurans CBS 112818]